MSDTRPFLCFAGVAPTVGDVAIGQSILQALKARFDLPIQVHTDKPDVFAALPEIDEADEVLSRLPAIAGPSLRSATLPFRIRALVSDLRSTGGAGVLPRAAYDALRNCLRGAAAMIFQGGPTWNDRMLDSRKALERWLFLEAARHYGTRVYHVGVSCGPFAWRVPQRLWMAPLCRTALDRYDILFVRDAFSRPALDRLRVTARVIDSTDAAVFLKAGPDRAYAHVEERIRAASGRPRVVVCVRDYQPAYAGAVAARETVLRTLATVLDHVQSEWANVFFLSTDHVPRSEKKTDVAVAREVQQMMRADGSIVIDDHVRNAAALKHIYGRFDAMVSMRLHPTILALDAGVPSLLLSYDRKCEDFFSRLEMAEYAVPLSDFRAHVAIRHLAQMLGNSALRDRIKARYAKLKATHARDYDAMFEQIAARAAALGSHGRARDTRAMKPAICRVGVP